MPHTTGAPGQASALDRLGGRRRLVVVDDPRPCLAGALPISDPGTDAVLTLFQASAATLDEIGAHQQGVLVLSFVDLLGARRLLDLKRAATELHARWAADPSLGLWWGSVALVDDFSELRAYLLQLLILTELHAVLAALPDLEDLVCWTAPETRQVLAGLDRRAHARWTPDRRGGEPAVAGRRGSSALPARWRQALADPERRLTQLRHVLTRLPLLARDGPRVGRAHPTATGHPRVAAVASSRVFADTLAPVLVELWRRGADVQVLARGRAARQALERAGLACRDVFDWAARADYQAAAASRRQVVPWLARLGLEPAPQVPGVALPRTFWRLVRDQPAVQTVARKMVGLAVVQEAAVSRWLAAVDPDVLLVAHDVSLVERAACRAARARGTASIDVQHAVLHVEQFQGGNAEWICVWGEASRRAAVALGRDPQRVVVTGPTRSGPTRAARRGAAPAEGAQARPRQTLVWATGLFEGLSWRVDQWLFAREALGALAQTLRRFPDLDCEIKLHPRDRPTPYDEHLAALEPELRERFRFSPHTSIADALAGAAAVLCNQSSVAVDAALAGVPVVELAWVVRDLGFGVVEAGIALPARCPDELPDVVAAVLEDARLRERLLEAQRVFCADYTHAGSAGAPQAIADLALAEARRDRVGL